MKNLYRANNKYMLRLPTIEETQIEFSEEKMKEICADKQFREKMRIASKPLLDRMDEYLEDSNGWKEKTKKNFFSSIMKYYIRSMKRATPFGLFASVGVGTFDKEEVFDDTNIRFQKKVNIDSSWLFGYIDRIEKNLYHSLEFKLNRVINQEGNRVTLIYTDRKDIEEISIRHTNVYEIVKKVCRSYVDFSELVNRIQKEYEDVSIEIIENYLRELIDKKILISSLRPPMTVEDPLSYVMKRCEELQLDVTDGLKKLQQLCLEYENTQIGDGIETYNCIVEYMKTMYENKHYLQVDTIMTGENLKMSLAMKKEMEHLATYLAKISEKSQKQKAALNQYRELFMDKYGFQRQVPILEMLDPIIGIGVPYGYHVPANEYHIEQPESLDIPLNLQNFLIKKYENAILSGKTIKLTKKELQKFIDLENHDKMPVSFEMYFTVTEKDGEIRLALSNVGGSICAGKTFGRFSIESEKIKEILEDINEQEREIRTEKVETCEINYLPTEQRTGNVTRCISKRELVLTGYTNVENEKKEIALEDILIGTTEHRFYAIDKRNGKEIVFGANNMYNIMLQPNAFRFLLEIENDGKVNWCECPWDHVFRSYRHIPQIEFENIILAKEKWFLSLDDLELAKKSTFEEFCKKFTEYRMNNQIPSKVNLTDFDNIIPLDLEEEIAMWIIFDEMKKKKGESISLEKIDIESNALCFESGKKYAAEIVVPVFRKGKAEQIEAVEKKTYVEHEKHLVFPFDNWLYMKVYCKKEREIELIALQLREYGQELMEKYKIEHFFMRYMDPKPHIRIRFYGRPEMLTQANAEILQWLKEMLAQKIIGDFNISIYEREMERYGGEELIEYAENLFRIDSIIVEEILYAKRTQQIDLEQEEIALLSILKYVMEFYPDYEEQIAFLTEYYHSNEFIQEFREKKENLMRIFDMENNWDDYISRADRKWLFMLLEQRDACINLYKEKIEEMDENPRFKKDIIASVLHLHCNRLLGTDRALESKIMSFAESLMYAKKYELLEIEKYG